MTDEKLKVDDRVRKIGKLGNKLGIGIIDKIEKNAKGHLDYLVKFNEQNASGWFRRQQLEKIPEEGEKKYACGHAPNSAIFNKSTIATSAYFTWKEQTDGGDNSKCFDCFCAGNKKRRR